MIKVAIIGAGGMGNVHARHYCRIPDVELGVFDPDNSRTTALAANFAAQPFNSIDDALTWATAADICAPNDLHCTLALQTIQAGKPTLVEKPLAEKLDEAEAIVKASDEATVPVMVGQVVRFFPEYRLAHNQVKSGALGRIAAVRMRRGGGLPRAPWFLDHNRSGGALVDLAIHEFDWLRWTLGPVDHLYARNVGAKTNEGPDYGLCTLTFKSGAVAHVEATWMDPGGFRTSFEICGSDGMAQFDSRQVATLRFAVDGTTRTESPLESRDDPYFRQLSAFVNSIRNETPMEISAKDALLSLQIATAARDSALTGKVITFP